ncbi:CLIP domain-containing serine protease B14-like [Anopheles bellator]|uniref:CLIP domain-containing serine protease B14-like n=1 Tax=Anopheles bellator TaxID=139047 RepID=UPI002648CEBF|nr:CLIP domain-containing serine protease B14-like [Anopheles bellator]
MADRTNPLLLLICLTLCSVSVHASSACTTPNGAPGMCVPVRSCMYVRDFIAMPSHHFQDTDYLEGLKCSATNGTDRLLVCCPRLLSEPNCGPMVAFGTRVYGGDDTEIAEFPWLALLRFRARNGKLFISCAGSLISRRFVLSAAHCFTEAKKKFQVLDSVRLGEWNFKNHRGRSDCKSVADRRVCRKDYQVVRVTLYPEYSVNVAAHLHDIALIELVGEVELNEFVAPICLPQSLVEVEAPSEYMAAGWGATSTESDSMTHVLQKIQLNQFDKERCRKAYPVPDDNGIGEGHICAGGIEGQDTCHGDSGGPLMESVDGVWYLAGITSFGWPTCGKQGVPGVYTNVSHYLDWLGYEVFRGSYV